MRKLIIGSFVAAALGIAALPAAARTNVDFYVNVAPPVALYEPVPVVRPGYVWVPGYWDWRYQRYVWVPGAYVRHRHGYVYAPHRWVSTPHGWRMHRGGWRHGDADGDGVPNAYDRRPNNPWRY